MTQSFIAPHRYLLLLATVTAPIGQVPGQHVVPSSGASAARYLPVNAPYAQKLLIDANAAHPELKKIGLHAIPPGQTESCIIANPITSKIGKVSSPNDLLVVSSGQSRVYPHSEEDGFYDLGLPMFDASRNPIGMMVMEIPYIVVPVA